MSFFTRLYCNATWSSKFFCIKLSNVESLRSSWVSLEERAFLKLDAYSVALFLIKPLTASQSILGSLTDPLFILMNSLSWAINWVLNDSSQSKVVLKRHLGACNAVEQIKARTTTALWSERVTGKRVTSIIFLNKPLEAKIKSIREKDLCLAERWVKSLEVGFIKRHKSTTPVLFDQERKASELCFCSLFSDWQDLSKEWSNTALKSAPMMSLKSGRSIRILVIFS